ncbi:hypothetical protein SEA_GODONK_31 [Gordonia phage GodonK]|uniref:Uncharacterized protein n=1 Tax=Gordonia phage GodonK TaxID=2562192 RepID=A0A4D6E1V8_9CAUD|nr:hypothetical protein HOV33_gp031 [Gordonia phage GodonK]QBZ72650.1 hypothetical protein SEA_GODONK_31 [Gordonia phage GodonK]
MTLLMRHAAAIHQTKIICGQDRHGFDQWNIECPCGVHDAGYAHQSLAHAKQRIAVHLTAVFHHLVAVDLTYCYNGDAKRGEYFVTACTQRGVPL